MAPPQSAALPPYGATEFAAKDHPHLADDWQSPLWTRRHMDDFNLDQKFLPRAALTQPFYYSGIEQVLAGGREVVADLDVEYCRLRLNQPDGLKQKISGLAVDKRWRGGRLPYEAAFSHIDDPKFGYEIRIAR